MKLRYNYTTITQLKRRVIMAKTLIDLRAEKGLYLKDVAENTGIPEEELAVVEQSGTVPPDIAQILIDTYYLPDTYFSEYVITSAQPKRTMKYFFGVSFVYSILTGLVAGIPTFINMVYTLVATFSDINQNGTYTELSTMDSPIFTVFNSIWTSAVYIISCIMFANFILKRTNYTGDIKKYQFLHYAIPSGVIAAFSMASASMTTLSYYMKSAENLSGALGVEAIGLVFSLISTLLGYYVHALLLKTAIEEDTEKKFRTLKKLAVFATISSILAFVITIVAFILEDTFDVFVVIRRIFVYGLYIAVAWVVALTKTDDEKKNKIAFTVLPLISILQPIVFSIIGEII